MFDLAVLDSNIDDIKQNKEKLLNQIKEVAENSQNAELLWRTAKVELYLSFVYKLNSDKVSEKQMLYSALKHSKNAIELEPTLIGAINTYCASLGCTYRYESLLKQAEFGAIMKSELLRGLDINPYDYHLYYTFGRWCYNICEVSKVQRKLASIMTGRTINSDYNEALEKLMKANELRPNYKPIYLWIAKVYIKLNNDNEAVKWLNEGLSLETNTEDDLISHNEIMSLLKKISN